MVTDLTQLTGDYAASWLPWLMIPLIFYILPFPVFALIFLWIENEAFGSNAENTPTEGLKRPEEPNLSATEMVEESQLT
jgi:photosystem I subunit VIII